MLFDLTRPLRPGTVLSVGVRPMSNSFGWVRPWLWQSCRMIWPGSDGQWKRAADSPIADFATTMAPGAGVTGWIGSTEPNLMARFAPGVSGETLTERAVSTRVEVWELGNAFPGAATAATVERQGLVGNAPVAHMADPMVDDGMRGMKVANSTWQYALAARLTQFFGWPIGLRFFDGAQVFGMLGRVDRRTYYDGAVRYSWLEFELLGAVSGVETGERGEAAQRWVHRPAAPFGPNDGRALVSPDEIDVGFTRDHGDKVGEVAILGVEEAEVDFGYRSRDSFNWDAAMDGQGWYASLSGSEGQAGPPELPGSRGRNPVARWNAGSQRWAGNYFRGRNAKVDVGGGSSNLFQSGYVPGLRAGGRPTLWADPEVLTGDPRYWVSLMAATFEVTDVGYEAASGSPPAADAEVEPDWYTRALEGVIDGRVIGGSTLRGVLRGGAGLWMRALPRFALLIPAGQGWLRSWWEFERVRAVGADAFEVEARLYRPVPGVEPFAQFDGWASWAQFAALGGVVPSSWAWGAGRGGTALTLLSEPGAARIIGGWGCDGDWG